MIYDEEWIIKDLIAHVQEKLPAAITAINAEKNDDLILDQIPNDSYLFETLDSRLLNYKGFFVLYGIVDTPIRKGNLNPVEDVTVTVQIGTFDTGDRDRTRNIYKLLRYRRVLRTVIIENPDIFRGYANASLVSLRPDAMPFGSNSIILKIGVDVTASITSF